MNQQNQTFAELFKKYRLRSEIETLSQFGDLLAQEGLVYENSLFTHWQKGDRVPKDRKLIMKIISIFVKRGSILSVFEANTIVAAADLRDLDDREIEDLQGLIKQASSGRSKMKTAAVDDADKSISYSLFNPSATAVLTGYFGAVLFSWALLQVFQMKHTQANLIFNLLYSTMPVVAGILGVFHARKWGYMNNSMGKAVALFSGGLITWGVGGLIWGVYNFIPKIEVPYPSYADVSYILSWPLWGAGIYYLSIAAGIKRNIKTSRSKKLLILVPIITISISYYLSVVLARGGAITNNADYFKFFFDVAYPLLDMLIITEAAIIYGFSFRLINGRYKWPLYLILCGIVIDYIADVIFSYQTSVGAFYNGAPVDIVFASAMYLLSLGLLNLSIARN
ncbi:hypothetical protein HYS00_02570 [Candidatus Microgenomates bacterium]|nr:hypothetical protein [Candidatus Microgenomates bacterium]